MNILVIIDSTGQDSSLGGAIDSIMKSKGWQPDGHFSYAYRRHAPHHDSLPELKNAIKGDVDAATLEAEWTHVKYMYVIDDHEPGFGLSEGI